MKIKPILFNTDMVHSLLDGHKSVTRRVVKPQPEGKPYPMPQGSCWPGYFGTMESARVFAPPYRPGDILYVRETWNGDWCDHYIYKADGGSAKAAGYGEEPKWHPSIHMPKEAARLFLRVTGVTAKHVQDITDEDARKEGCTGREDFHRVWNDCYAKPRPIKDECGVITHYESYPWEDIRETRTYRGKPWHVIGNPWVWVIEFERCERPRGTNSAPADEG